MKWQQQLDLETACVGFVYGEIDCGYRGRIYYWYDPEGKLPAVEITTCASSTRRYLTMSGNACSSTRSSGARRS